MRSEQSTGNVVLVVDSIVGPNPRQNLEVANRARSKGRQRLWDLDLARVGTEATDTIGETAHGGRASEALSQAGAMESVWRAHGKSGREVASTFIV